MYKLMEGVKRIERELVYKGAILDMYKDTMQFPDGHTSKWDYLDHRGNAAAVIPITNDGEILMVSQYRNSVDGKTLEIPAGCLDFKDEPTVRAAARELEEETGFRAGKIEKLLTIVTAVAYCNELIDIYIATDLTKGERHLDDDEDINVLKFPIKKAKEMIRNGEIIDAKTVAAILAIPDDLIK
jgi:ADP-ribose pyrophosphatase